MSHPLLPVGAQTYSKARAAYPANAPEYVDMAIGAHIWGSDGRVYIDCVSALGAILLGHQHPDVDEAVRAQMTLGNASSLPTNLEGQLAERLVGMLPGADWQVRFAKNGADVTSAAVRLARAHTGRDRVLMYGNGYHGAQDWSMTQPPRNAGVPAAVRDLTHFVTCHDLEDIADVMEETRPACMVFEAVVTADPLLPPPGYFQQLRALADRWGVLLVLDEMVTGFRCGLPGAVTQYGIEPDLICFGKGMANGYSTSALVGRREIMQRVERDVFMSSTFGGEPIGLAASLATLAVAEAEQVPVRLADTGLRLAASYTACARRYGLETRLVGYPQRVVMRWADPAQRQAFLEALVDLGLLCPGYINLTLAMTAPNIEAAIAKAIDQAMAAVVGLSVADTSLLS